MNATSCAATLTTAPGTRRDTEPRAGFITAFFGILLPTFTLLFEITSRMCAGLAFDPIPTVWHMALAATVPVANTAAVISLRCRDAGHTSEIMWLNSIAIGVSICYTLAFAVMTPFAVIALIACGLGLLPLTPLISLLVTLNLRRKLKYMAALQQINAAPSLQIAIPLVFAAMILLGASRFMTFTGAKLTENESTRTTGIQFMKNYGSEEHLLRLCYRSESPLSPIVLVTGLCELLRIDSSFMRLDPKTAQKLYYRITGNLYDSVRPPDIRGLLGRNIGSTTDANEFDWSQGGDSVAAPINGLALQHALIESSVDTDSASSYTEWTLIFKNDSTLQREARAMAALPPGGVVSRLTLWIDGQEHEAAYGERSKVKSAYKAVVEQRRDPVLATTAGKDLVLLQCFPVPPTGGVMKIRIGITAPLTLESPENGLLRLPFFTERNFTIPETITQPVAIQANATMTTMAGTTAFTLTSPNDDSYNARAELTYHSLSNPFTIRFRRAGGLADTWTEASTVDGGGIVCQSIAETANQAPEQVIIVVDGSGRMAMHRDIIRRAITGLPESTGFSVLLAKDEAIELCPMRKRTAAERRIAADSIMDADFEGGCDNKPALDTAFKLIDSHEHSSIAWIHTAQPVELSDRNESPAPLQRRTYDRPLYELQLGTGPNVLRGKIQDVLKVELIPDFGDTNQALERLSSFLAGTAKEYRFNRQLETSGSLDGKGKHAWSHLSRLWAYDEVLRLEKSGKSSDRARAISLATSHQLVTPVSAAVVLETEQQYKNAGLKPVDPATVPGIAVVPEPETWALIAIGTFIMTLSVARQRKCA